MDQSVKDALKYLMGTIAALCAFMSLLLQFTHDLLWIVNYTILLVIMTWIAALHFRIIHLETEVRHENK